MSVKSSGVSTYILDQPLSWLGRVWASRPVGVWNRPQVGLGSTVASLTRCPLFDGALQNTTYLERYNREKTCSEAFE